MFPGNQCLETIFYLDSFAVAIDHRRSIAQPVYQILGGNGWGRWRGEVTINPPQGLAPDHLGLAALFSQNHADECIEFINSNRTAAEPLVDLEALFVALRTQLVNSRPPQATQFSPDIVYHFYLENDTGSTAEITCSFSREQVVTCAGLNGLSVKARVGEMARNGDVRVFAGLRDDPFFFDREAFAGLASSGLGAFSPPGKDFHAGANVMALVLGVKIVYTKRAVRTVSPGTLILWHDLIGVAFFMLACHQWPAVW